MKNHCSWIKVLSLFYAIFGICIPIVCHQAFQKITVLTQPVGYDGDKWCHPGVIRSLLEGLKQNGISFNYNPSSLDELGDVVMVPSCFDALRQAISWKKKGIISLLLAGPNLVVLPCDHERIMTSDAIDGCIVPSEPVKKIYTSVEPCLADHIFIWYAGIDTEYWSPLPIVNQKSKQVLVYWKTESEEFCTIAENILRKHGWDPIRIRYGSYQTPDFKEYLSHCRFAVFVSKSESQGLALVESWAMNVPTFPWNPRVWHYKGASFPMSSCPYLTHQSGFDWTNFDEFEYILQNIEERLSLCSPRKWVLENMTDKISVAKLIDNVNVLYSRAMKK